MRPSGRSVASTSAWGTFWGTAAVVSTTSSPSRTPPRLRLAHPNLPAPGGFLGDAPTRFDLKDVS